MSLCVSCKYTKMVGLIGTIEKKWEKNGKKLALYCFFLYLYEIFDY